jgi:hypothetical protein
MDQEGYDQASERLASWTQSLTNRVTSMLPQARDVLSGKAKLPDGCPSREAGVEIGLRGIGSDIEEVMCAYDDMYRALGFSSRFSKDSK